MQVWLWIRERVLALKPLRVPLLLVVGGLFFLLSGQGEDVARALAERRTADSDAVWQTRCFFAATLVWSLSAWYWARVMVRVKFPDVAPLGPRLRTWTPRLIGFVAAAGVALSFWRAARGYAPTEHADVQENLLSYAYWSAAGAVAFLAATAVRRWLFNLPHAKDESYAERFTALGGWTLTFLGLMIAAAVGFFFLFAWKPVEAAPVFGSAALILIAAAGWIAVGSTLDYAGMKFHVPVFTALLLLAIGFSWWNDNHAVRTLDAQQAAARPDVSASLKSWLARHEAKLKNPKSRIPLYLVNAEGGGIRAAYWTVTVLGEIQNNHPAFAEHLYSISGVSGGSLGAAVFVALLDEARQDRTLNVKTKAQAILGEDFLSPVVAGILYPDLAQRIWPQPIAALDRAATLEKAWEDAYQKHMKDKRARLSEPFDLLWDDPKQWTPTLVLNATWVETGKRIITSNLRVAASKDNEDFVDSEDANAFFYPRSLRLSTAAHMSARFTYVSPAGTLLRDGLAHGRVVDGGYFENSGATATLEILQTAQLLAQEDKRWRQVDIYVIHISNEPVDPRFANDALSVAPYNPRIAPKRLLNEARSPISTIFNTRDARGHYSRESLAWQAGKDHYLHFGLCRTSSNVPLGWVLSQSTRERMETQLLHATCKSAQGTIFDNPAALKTIGGHLPAAATAKKF